MPDTANTQLLLADVDEIVALLSRSWCSTAGLKSMRPRTEMTRLGSSPLNVSMCL